MAFVLTLTVQTAGKTVRLGAEPGQRPGEWVGFLAEREEAAARKQLSLPHAWRACIKFGVRDPRDGWQPA